jgi:hypothetical protein
VAGLRTIYLTSSLSKNGRDHFAGRVLFDALRDASDEILLGHCVMGDDAPVPAYAEDEVIREATFRSFQPNLIYFEGGLGGLGDERWRVPRMLLENTVRAGATAFIADVDQIKLAQENAVYVGARDFLRARVRFHEDAVVYAADLDSNWVSDRIIVVQPRRMVLEPWLRPVYDGVDEIVAGNPLLLSSWDSIFASGNRDTTGVLALDVWIDRHHPAPFGSVTSYGRGHVVFVAANISSDRWAERTPGNTRWIVNSVLFLGREAAAEASRRAPLQELQAAVTAARAAAGILDGDQAGDVMQEGVTPAIEKQSAEIAGSRAASAAEQSLETIFGARLWERVPQSARRFLVTGEVLRTRLDIFSSAEPELDFSWAVLTYSKALESALAELVFVPYRDAPNGFRDFPAALNRESIDKLNRYVERRDRGYLGLGDMAHCLANLGCAPTDDGDNGFRRFLESRGVDVGQLCGSSLPNRLIKYVSTRNRAAHVSLMSLDDAIAVRRLLLEEPARLLVQLVSRFA